MRWQKINFVAVVLMGCAGSASSVVRDDPQEAGTSPVGPASSEDAQPAEDGAIPTTKTDSSKPPDDSAVLDSPVDVGQPDVVKPPTCAEKCVAEGQTCGQHRFDPNCDCGMCPGAQICSREPAMMYGTCGNCPELDVTPCLNIVQPPGHTKHRYDLTCPYLPASQQCVVHDGGRCCKDPP